MSYSDLPYNGAYPPGVTGREDYFNDDPDGEDEDDRTPIPCSKCGAMTSWDPTYQDLCHRCIRADNE